MHLIYRLLKRLKVLAFDSFYLNVFKSIGVNLVYLHLQVKMSPERLGYSEEEQVLTPKMSVPASPVAGTPVREAQSPISILLAVAHNQIRNDDDLTSLSWLQDKDILKG